MAKKVKGKQPVVDGTEVSETPATPSKPEKQVEKTKQESSTSGEEVPHKVNTANLAELKSACDECVKEYFGRPTAFSQSHTHEDIRLALGWSSTIIAFASAYYGYRTEFQESKFWVTVGVALYMLLSGASALYSQYIEKNVIFVGKRRTVASRISTERLTVSSTVPPSPTAPKSYVDSILAAVSLAPTPEPASAADAFPSYKLSVSYVHSSNNGKSLIHHADATLEKPFAAWFDEEGSLWKEGFEKALEELLSGIVG
ncbi:hypothetical protein T439DRAFT_381194 [Meredithblackwellia eburnea MCA 4105]